MRFLKEKVKQLKLKFKLWRGIQQDQLTLTLNGGLGDVILVSQYLCFLRNQYPQLTLIIHYRDGGKVVSNPEAYSYGGTRLYTGLDGESNNPIFEWLAALDLNATLIGSDIDKQTYGIKVFANRIKDVMFEYLAPVDYQAQVLSRMTALQNRAKASDILTISLHLRRNADTIIAIAEQLQTILDGKVQFLILGSTEHQLIPSYSCLAKTTAYVDSYQQGLSLFDVLSVSQQSDLFIGGRGGFELFHWLAGVPSVCIFDDGGFKEVEDGMWDPIFWNTNTIDKLFSESESVEDIVAYIKPKVLSLADKYE